MEGFITILKDAPVGVFKVALPGFLGLPKDENGNFICSDGARFEEICWDSGFIEKKPTRNAIRTIFSYKSTPRLDIDIDYETYTTPTLRESIYDYQRRMISKCVAAKKILLDADMGLGKTLVGSVYAAVLHVKSTLIMCPGFLIKNWVREIPMWTGKDVAVLRTSKQRVPTSGFVLCSYDLAKINPDIFNKHWETVICDESQAFCGESTLRSNQLVPMIQRADHILLMTGTPQKAKPMELFNQLTILNPTLFTFLEYAERYCDGKITEYGTFEAKGHFYDEEVHLLLKSCMLRVRADDSIVLPLLTRTYIQLDVDEIRISEMKARTKALQKAFYDAPPKEKKYKMNALSAYNREVRRLTARLKLEPGWAWFIKEFNEQEGRKWVLFVEDLVLFESLGEKLRNHDPPIPFSQINGKVKMEKRQELIDCVANPNTPERVALLTMKTCSIGLTLSPGATRMVIFELPDTPDTLDQAEKRIHRFGCVEPVTVYYLIGKNSQDINSMRSLKAKRKLNKRIIDGEGI